MMMAAKSGLPDPFIFVPSQGRPQLLFVLLHGEAGTPQQLFPLADAIKSAFPLAMVVLPYAFQNIPADSSAGALGSQGIAGYHWVDPLGLNEGNYAERVGRSLPRLIEQISRLQADYGLSGAQTALAGFSQGATMALEASCAKPGIAGRVLAFSGLYVQPPSHVPSTTTLHFFHGANDQQVSVAEVESTLLRLAELQGDATLDVASRIGHELHQALIKQAIVRLQTCVPLRNWEDALQSLERQAKEQGAKRRKGPTLH